MHPAKSSIVADINKKLNASPYIFIADYTGVDVVQFSELRNRLDKAGARCHVVKNSFLRLAAKDAGLPDLGELRGQNAVIIGDKDVAAAAKVVKTFSNEFKKLTLKTGIIDKLIVDAAQINIIADLPSREVLLSQLLGVLQAPASTLVRLLNTPASQLARVLGAYGEKGAGGAGTPAPAAAAPTAEAAPAAEAPAAESAAPASEAPAAEAPAAEAPAADAPAEPKAE